jgi:hypothetical protein
MSASFVYAFVYAVRYNEAMPKEPMVQRLVRVPLPLWERAKKRADERGETVSEAVRKFLERYSR